MTFIDQKTSQEIAEWTKKNPEKAKEYAELHKKWATEFIAHRMSYQEFHRLHEEWRKKNIL